MMALFFGIIDFSFVVYLQSTFTHAAREAARFAITFRSTYGTKNCDSSQAACIIQVAQDNASGFLSGANASYIAVNYYTANDLANPVMKCTSGGCTQTGALPQALPSGKTVSFANQPGNLIEVVVNNYPWNWLVPIAGFSPGAGLKLSAAASDVLGGLAVGALVPPNP